MRFFCRLQHFASYYLSDFVYVSSSRFRDFPRRPPCKSWSVPVGTVLHQAIFDDPRSKITDGYMSNKSLQRVLVCTVLYRNERASSACNKYIRSWGEQIHVLILLESSVGSPNLKA